VGNKFLLHVPFEEHNLQSQNIFYAYGLLDAFSIKQFNSGHFTYDFTFHRLRYAGQPAFIKNDYAHLSFTDFI
jgi:hypothetical protein